MHSTHKIPRYFLCLIGFFLIAAVFLNACNTSRPSFDNHGIYSIKVVMDNNYPPFTFLDANGQPQGILIDRWRLWEQKTGIKVQITTTDWEQALQRMANGEFDVIDTIFYNTERAKIYDALISDRPYRTAFPKSEAIDLILSLKGKQFDPQLTDIFLEIIAEDQT